MGQPQHASAAKQMAAFTTTHAHHTRRLRGGDAAAGCSGGVGSESPGCDALAHHGPHAATWDSVAAMSSELGTDALATHASDAGEEHMAATLASAEHMAPDMSTGEGFGMNE